MIHERPVIELIEAILVKAGFEVGIATTAEEALHIIPFCLPAVVLTDIQLPGSLNGLDLLRAIKKKSNSTARIICMSGFADSDMIAKCYNSGAVGFLRKPFDISELVAMSKMAADTIRYVDDVKSHIEVLLTTVDLKDHYTGRHSKRVAKRACLIGEMLGFSARELDELLMGGWAHDIGKIGVSDDILNKPGKLTEREFYEVKKHPTQFQTITEPINLSNDAKDGAADHHERFDGSGYPFGRMGNNIHLWGRIYAIVDVYDALTSARSYKPAWTHWEAVHELNRQKGKHFDPEILEVFLDLCRQNSPEFILNH